MIEWGATSMGNLLFTGLAHLAALAASQDDDGIPRSGHEQVIELGEAFPEADSSTNPRATA